ncbi:MAG: O-antigen ligase family protein [Acidimicrobiales bacterium]
MPEHPERWHPSPQALFVGGALIAVTAAGLLAHQGRALRYVFPAVALLGALALYRSRPLAYLGLVWWLWILSPEVRRLSDYQAGYDSLNPIMLAPLLAGGLCVFTLLRRAPSVRSAKLRGIAGIIAGLVVATATGLVLNGASAAIYALATWLVPPLFAAHLGLEWKSYPQLRRTMFRLSVATTVVISAYSLVQFFVFPAWDRYWGVQSRIGEYLHATARHLRPFSTLNSAGPFAFVLVLMLLIVFQSRSRLRAPTLVLGVVALTLTQVRSAWGVFVLGMGYLIVSQGHSLRKSLRILLVAVIPVLAITLQSGPVAKLIDSRFHTVTAVSTDESFNARLHFLSYYAPAALLDPIGHGIASTTSATKLVGTQQANGTVTSFDNGFLDIPYSLGWLGTALYVTGGLVLMREAARASPQDSLVSASRAVGISAIVFLLFGSDLFGVEGFFVWLPLGLALASRSHAAESVAGTAAHSVTGAVLRSPTGVGTPAAIRSW